MSETRKLTPQGVSALLRRAGFARHFMPPHYRYFNVHEPATDGFSVSLSPVRTPGLVEVRWAGACAEEARMLGLYRKCIEGAGFQVTDGNRGRPFLMVTAADGASLWD